jgi:hypothetical protein
MCVVLFSFLLVLLIDTSAFATMSISSNGAATAEDGREIFGESILGESAIAGDV